MYLLICYNGNNLKIVLLLLNTDLFILQYSMIIATVTNITY